VPAPAVPISPADKPPSDAPPIAPIPDSGAPPEASEVEALDERQQTLIAADRLWLQGQYEQAELLYRKVKNPFTAQAVQEIPPPITDPALLPPAGQVYWREAEAGRSQGMTTRTEVALGLLTEQIPQFLPGQIRYAELLLTQDRAEAAIENLEQAATLYPDQPDLVKARVAVLAANDRHLEASIAARQFTLLYPDHAAVPELTTLAAEQFDEFQDRLRGRLTGNAIANILTGTLGFALTGGLFGPLTAIETTALLLRGESAIGEQLARQATQQLELIEDPAIVAYVNELGQKLAAVTGRDEFEYQFYVVRNNELNAFALPGGKIFVNAGAILHAQSEAELAGLLAHELSHTVLSHGFQLVTSGNLTANLLQFVPYGGLATDLLVLRYSREMEQQADALGTRLLATSGYAADGLHSLMVTLAAQEAEPFSIDWLSSHPDTQERVADLETLIDRSGYNRYAYEGVEHHLERQARVAALLEQGKLPDDRLQN
jgi:predicted Zn-dependent protease